MNKKIYNMFDKINEGLLEDLRKTNIKFPEVDQSCSCIVDIVKDVEEHGSTEAKKLIKAYKKQMEENDMMNNIKNTNKSEEKTSDEIQKILSSKVNK